MKTRWAAALVMIAGSILFAVSEPPSWATGLGLSLAALIVYVGLRPAK